MKINKQNFSNKFQLNEATNYKVYFAARKRTQPDKFQRSNRKNVAFAGIASSEGIIMASKCLNGLLAPFKPNGELIPPESL